MTASPLPTKHQTVLDAEECLARLAVAWDDLFDDSGAIRVVSMEFAFRFLEGELALRRLNNDRLRKLLIRLLRSKEHWEISKPTSLYAIRSLLSQELARDPHDARISSLVASGSNLLAGGEYVRAVLSALEGHVSTSKPFDADLSWLLRELAAAFVLKGFDRGQVHRLINDAFLDTTTAHDGILHSTFPYEVIRSELPELDPASSESVATYNEALTRVIESLTVADRFRSILSLYQQEAKEITYIFAVNGLKGLRSHRIGRIELYAPFQTPKIDKKMEMFGRDISDCLNAAILLSSLGSEENRSEAAQLIQADLDLMAFYITSRLPMEVDGRSCIMINADGSLRGVASRTHSFGEPIEHKYFAHNVDELAAHPESLRVVTDVATELTSVRRKSDASVDEALRAISKSGESGVLEDRLVNAWIAIEALMGPLGNKESLAAEIVPALVVSDARWQVGWGLLHYLRRHWANFNLNGQDVLFEKTPEELLRRSLIIYDPWGSQDLRNFIQTLDEWLHLAPAGSNYYNRISFAKAFYSDARAAKKELFSRSQSARDDLTLIYQVRNRIVHHAFRGSPGMEYLVQRAEVFARLMMIAVLRTPAIAVEALIAKEIVRAERLMYHVEHDPSFDLLGDEF